MFHSCIHIVHQQDHNPSSECTSIQDPQYTIRGMNVQADISCWHSTNNCGPSQDNHIGFYLRSRSSPPSVDIRWNLHNVDKQSFLVDRHDALRCHHCHSCLIDYTKNYNKINTQDIVKTVLKIIFSKIQFTYLLNQHNHNIQSGQEWLQQQS